MAVGDWPHQGPLHQITNARALAKSQPSSFGTTPSGASDSSRVMSSAPCAGLSLLKGMLTEPGMVPLSNQSGVRASISTPEPSASRVRMNSTSSTSPMVSTPGAARIGWAQKGGQGREVRA